MRRFNPEKELRKIHHGNRNKIILFVISLLVVGVIGYSFALYQVRYSKRIIYTKIVPFSNVTFSKPENITITPEKYLLKTGETKTFTAALPDNYKIDTVTCTNSDVTDITENTFKIVYTTSKASECTVTIVMKDPLASNPFYATMIANKDQTANNDPNNNLRYIGKNPNNYIWFNCNDYNNLTQMAAVQKCEKWRIIGLFNNVTKSNGIKENLVKIIRSESIGNITWDNTNKNIWSTASLSKGLNGPYLSGNDSTWITSSEYTYFLSGREYANTIADNYKSITNSTKEMIEQVTWNIGGYNGYVTTAEWYTYERGNKVPTGAQAIWNGYIGLMYPSDYGYATSGGDSTDRDTCLANSSDVIWRDENYKTDCAGNSWLWNSIISQWTLVTFSGNSTSVIDVRDTGQVGSNGASYRIAVRPSLYLKSNVKIVNGDGSEETPYILAL